MLLGHFSLVVHDGDNHQEDQTKDFVQPSGVDELTIHQLVLEKVNGQDTSKEAQDDEESENVCQVDHDERQSFGDSSDFLGLDLVFQTLFNDGLDLLSLSPLADATEHFGPSVGNDQAKNERD